MIRLLDENEVRATLPISADSLSANIGADFATGTSLDLALIMVGKRSAPYGEISRDDLRGSCAVATHVVQSATLGAFTLASGSRAHARSTAELFGASAGMTSQSGKSTFLREGSAGACSASNAAAPPDSCDAALRVELLPIGQPEAPLVLIAQQDAARFRGKFCPELGDCQRRCSASEASACNHLSILYAIGDRVDRDLSKASALSKRACDLGDMNACTLLGLSLITRGPYANLERGLDYLTRACKRGVQGACGALSDSYRNAGDLANANAYAQRACALGYESFCGQVR
jgi:hypothetical protein